MSDISIGQLPNTSDAGYQSAALQNLDKEAFLKLLVAQMQYQNPLNPADSNEYLAQAAQYASVEQLENMAQSQAELRSMQMVSIATDLVGREITASNPLTGELVTGTVTGVRFGEEPILIVDGFDIPLSSVVGVGTGAPGGTGGDHTDAAGDTATPEPLSEAEGALLAPPLTDDTAATDDTAGTDPAATDDTAAASDATGTAEETTVDTPTDETDPGIATLAPPIDSATDTTAA